MTRAVFLGSPPFAVPPLRALLGSSLRPALVVTPPDRPRGRGLRLAPSEVARAAEEAGVPVLRSAASPAPADLERASGGRPDLLLVVSFGAILPRALLDLPSLGAFNLHASLLPRHRGASPVAAAILAGDRQTGLTVQRMVERLDAGPIVLTRETPIGEGECAGELTTRLAELGGPLLLEAIERVVGGRATLHEQDESRATRARRLKREDGRIVWSRRADEIDRHVRAMTPWPGAFTEMEGVELAVLRGRPEGGTAGGAPGRVLSAGEGGILVACGTGGYRI
ncbi:MAG TPA: methionyl-tRNA formyltransferase, partial [Planctomycetota bacterium]|nr:methionyl-tRNA formyltransferase [Planctomycetota bacterium]